MRKREKSASTVQQRKRNSSLNKQEFRKAEKQVKCSVVVGEVHCFSLKAVLNP